MPYEFQTIDIAVFDYHSAIAPLESPELVQKDLRFLVAEDEYNTRYGTPGETLTQHFKIRPLRWRSLTYHHFWKHYQTIWSSGARPDFWRFQMPFLCKPLQPDMSVITGDPAFEGRVRAYVFLSALGWSTNFDIRLRGVLKPAQFRDFVRKLVVNAAVFEIAGKPRTLAQSFEHYSEGVTQDIYTPKFVDSVRIKRHFIISPSEFAGDVSAYRTTGLGIKQMPASDRAMLHGLLKGRVVDVPEVIKLEKEKKFLQTDFNPPDFALTYFDHGTLLFLQRAALRGTSMWKKRRSAVKCHTSNIRNYSLMTLAQRRFHADTKGHSGKKDKIDLLRGYIETTLGELPNRYTNPFCERFHSTYGPTKDLLGGS